MFETLITELWARQLANMSLQIETQSVDSINRLFLAAKSVSSRD